MQQPEEIQSRIGGNRDWVTSAVAMSGRNIKELYYISIIAFFLKVVNTEKIKCDK
jgi:hypothetical protein